MLIRYVKFCKRSYEAKDSGTRVGKRYLGFVPILFSNGSRGNSPILSGFAIPKGFCVLYVLQGT
jgi:hypothetical protein